MFDKDEIDSPLESEEEDFQYYKVEEESAEDEPLEDEPLEDEPLEEEIIEEVKPAAPETPKGFKETFPTIQSLINAWRRGNKEEIAKLAGSEKTDLVTLKNIWKNA
jgi:hypothetical protein